MWGMTAFISGACGCDVTQTVGLLSHGIALFMRFTREYGSISVLLIVVTHCSYIPPYMN